MTEDPRLRLLGSQAADSLPGIPGAENPAAAVLRRLDETEVIVAIDSHADYAARVAAAAFITMIARLVPTVVVDSSAELPANWWQATSWADLLDRLESVRPQTDLPPAAA